MSLLDLLEQELKRSEERSSITIGTPSKGGKLKVYFDAGDEEGARARVIAATKTLEFAKQEYRRVQDTEE